MWIVFALLAMISTSVRFVYSKRAVDSQPVPVALAALFVVITSNAFFYWVTIRVLIDAVSMFTNLKAFSYEEVSYVVPIVALLPILSSGTSWLINGEQPSLVAYLGMIIVMIGVGTLFVSKVDWKNLSANQNLLKATGYMLTTVLIWSFAEAIHKQGIGASSPATYFLVSFLGFAFIYTVISLIWYRQQVLQIFSRPFRVDNIGNGLGLAGDRIFSLAAIQTGLVSYVGAIKSTSVALTGVFAALFLKEKITGIEWFGIGLCTLGVIIISVF